LPKRQHAADWVLGLRNQLRNTVGTAYRVGEQRSKAKLDVRFSDGSRKAVSLGIPWNAANAGLIQRKVEDIAKGVATGKTITEMVSGNRAKDSAPEAAPEVGANMLVDLYDRWGQYMVRQNQFTLTGSWEQQYRYTRNKLVLVTEANSAEQLLEAIASMFEKPGRSKQIRLQNTARFLRWCVKNNHLPANRWSPPAQVKDIVGKVPKKTGESIPIKDDEILELLDSLPDTKPAERWKTVIQLLATYGLRPIEVRYLNIRATGRLWCEYSKRSGGGSTDPRELKPLHPEWEEQWNLRQKIKAGLDLPPFGGGVADAARRYLMRHQGWQKLADKNVTLYAFRHGYALRAHQQYGISTRMAAKWMGHSHATHCSSYGEWADTDESDAAFERAIRYRDRLKG
jgi:integrase